MILLGKLKAVYHCYCGTSVDGEPADFCRMGMWRGGGEEEKDDLVNG